MKRNILFFLLIISEFTFSQNAILDKANNYVLSSVGKSFFEKYISLNEKLTTKDMVVYNFRIQKKPEINKLLIIFFINGEIDAANSHYKFKQLKNCQNNPYKCLLPMDENTATQVVQKQGYLTNQNEWKSSFILWKGEKGNYKWNFTHSAINDPQNETISINALTGEIEHTISISEHTFN